MKIILEETYDLFDLILTTPEGLQGGRVAHNESQHCFSVFLPEKSVVHLVFRCNLLFFLNGWPLVNDVICLAYIHIFQDGLSRHI